MTLEAKTREDDGRLRTADRLRRARNTAALTQEQVGSRILLDPHTISSYENGRVKPSGPALYALSRVYGKPVEWFFAEESVLDSLIAGFIGDPTPEEEELLRKLRELSAEEKEAITVVIASMHERPHGQAISPRETEIGGTRQAAPA